LGGFGLGRTAALAIDLGGPWGAEWRAWPGSQRVISQTLHWLLRAPVAEQVALSQAPTPRGWALTAHLQGIDGNSLNARVLFARLHARSGKEEVIPLVQHGSGSYSGMLASRLTAPTPVIVEDRSQGQSRLAGQGWLGLSYPEEYRVRPPNHGLLEELRLMTGGRLLDKPGVEPALRPAERRRIPLAPWLASLALALFLLEVSLQQGFPTLRRRVLRARRHQSA
jgi:hypothetical protein